MRIPHEQNSGRARERRARVKLSFPVTPSLSCIIFFSFRTFTVVAKAQQNGQPLIPSSRAAVCRSVTPKDCQLWRALCEHSALVTFSTASALPAPIPPLPTHLWYGTYTSTFMPFLPVFPNSLFHMWVT